MPIYLGLLRCNTYTEKCNEESKVPDLTVRVVSCWTHLLISVMYSRFRDLEIHGTLWNTSRYPYFDLSDLRNWGKQLIEQPPLTEWIFNLTPKLDILKILWKRGEIAPKEQFLLFFTLFCCLLVDLCVITGTRFSLRDKRLFEISEFEITRVYCTDSPWKTSLTIFKSFLRIWLNLNYVPVW